MADPYRVLGVKRDATPDEIKRAFTALALALHPDTAPQGGGAGGAGGAGNAALAAERFARAKEAFDVLRDAGRRAAHDRRASGFAGGAGAGAGAGGPGYSPEDLRRRAEEFEQWRRAQPQRPAGAYASATAGGGGGDSGSGFGDFGAHAAPPSGAFRAGSGQAALMSLLERALRPRSIAALLVLPAAVWFCSALLAREVDVTGEAYGGAGNERVRAWYNPRSQQWEPPAPWDPLFQAHRGATKMVARREVRPSTLAPAPEQAAQGATPLSVAAAVAAAEVADAERIVAAVMPAAAGASAAAADAASSATQAAAGARAALPPIVAAEAHRGGEIVLR